MSRTVDSRVVEMQFNNSQFEQNVKTSMSTLDKLKQALHFKGATQGIENVNAAARNFNVNGMTSALDHAGSRFSALEVMGVTALANLTNSAVNAGKRIVAAFTIDPIRTGFNEYELKLDSMRTIVASTGESIETVNRYLDELNEYSDRTIYSFADMTQNIGKFTNAGVKLEDAVLAIKGISNEAAVSGANANEASRAMYNFAQALSAGYVKLIDWRSIETANMATVEFRNQLMQAAVAAGTLTEASDGMYRTVDGLLINATHNFNESLQDQWMTTEVLVNTLKDYADETTEIGSKAFEAAQEVTTFTKMVDALKEAAQSGWAHTWEIIIGTLDEAKEFWTPINNILSGWIDGMSDFRNNWLSNGLGSGWSNLTQRIKDMGLPIEDFEEQIEHCAHVHGYHVQEMIENQGSLSAVIEAGLLPTYVFDEAIERWGRTAHETTTETEDLTGRLEEFQDVVNRVWRGEFGRGQARRNALAELGYDAQEIQDLVNLGHDHVLTLDELTPRQLEAIGYTEEQIAAIQELGEAAADSDSTIAQLIDRINQPSGRDLLLGSLFNVLQAIQKVITTIGSAWRKVFPASAGEGLYRFAEALNNITEKLILTDEHARQLGVAFEGVFNVLKVAGKIVKTALGTAYDLIRRIFIAIRGERSNFSVFNLLEKAGNALTRFSLWVDQNDRITRVFETISNVIVAAVTKIREWIVEIYRLPAVQTILNRVKSAIRDFANNAREYFGLGLDKVREFLGRLSELDDLSLSAFIQLVKDFFLEIIENISEMDFSLDGIISKITEFKNAILNNFPEAVSLFQSLRENMSGVFGMIAEKIPIALSVGFAVYLISTLRKLGAVLEQIARPFEFVTQLMNGVTGLLAQARKYLKALAFAARLNAISLAVLQFAIAVGVLAASIWILSQIDSSKMWSCVGAIAVLVALLIALAAAMALLSKHAKNSIQTSALLVSLAASLLILAFALKIMSSLEMSNTIKNATILAALMVVLGGVATLMSRWAPELSKGSAALIVMALAVGLLAASLWVLSKMDINSLGKSLSILGALVAMLALLGLASGKLSFGGGVGLLAMVIALKILLTTFDDIAAMDLKTIVKSLSVIVIIFGMFALLMWASSLAGEEAAGAGAEITLITAALLLVIQAIKQIADIPASALIKGLTVISIISSIFVALIAVTKLAGKNAIRAGVMLMMMAVALIILTVAIQAIGSMDVSVLAKATGVITSIGAIFVALIAVTKFAKDAKATIITLTACIVALATMVIILSQLDRGNLMAATAALDSIVLVFAALIASLKFLELGGWKDTAKTVLFLISLTVIVGMLGTIVYMLAKCGAGSAIGAAVSISILLLTMAGCLAILKLMNAETVYPAIGAMAGLTLIVGALAAIIMLMSSLNPGQAIATAISLSILLLTMSAVCAILTMIGAGGAGTVAATTAGLISLIETVVVIGALLVAIGALITYFPIIETFINTGIELLKSMARGLGEVITSFAAGLTSGLPEIGTNLSSFMENIQGFIDGANGISSDAVNGINSIVSMITSLTRAGIVDAVSNAFGGTSMSEWGDQLVEFGTAMATFSDTISGENIDVDAISTLAQAGEALANMCNNIPNSGFSIASIFVGDNSPDVWGEQLVSFANSMCKVSAAIGEGSLNVEAIQALANAATPLAELCNNIPNSGLSIASIFVGDNSPDVWGIQLVAFAKAMRDVSDVVSDGAINTGAIQGLANAATPLAELCNNLPNTSNGGFSFATLFAGDNSPDVWGEQLVSFASSMCEVSDAVGEEGAINVAAIQALANAATPLAELCDNIPNSGLSFASIFAGDNAPDKWGEQLETFATCMANVSEKAADIDTSSMSALTTVSGRLVTLSQRITELPAGMGVNDIDQWSERVKDFGEDMGDFSDSISGIDAGSMTAVIDNARAIANFMDGLDRMNFEGVESFKTALESFGDISFDGFMNSFSNSGQISSAGENIMGSLVRGINSGRSNLINALNGALNSALNSISSKRGQFQSYGTAIMTSFSSGMRSRSDSIRSVVSSIVTAASSSMRGSYATFRSLGSYLVDGFCAGISENTYRVRARASAMAHAAEQAAREQLEINSPSKVFRRIGAGVPEGFIQGIGMLGDEVVGAVDGMASEAITSTSKSIGRISDMISNGIDAQPTIRPVLDLSDVESGVGSIGSMFGGVSVGAMYRAGAIGASMNSRQNGANSDVISAINDLGRRISESSGDTYNVNGVTYDDGSNVAGAVRELVNAARVERRR